jgi:hypothetical protein
MRRILAMAGAAAIVVLAVPASASAHTATQQTGDAKCNADWYVNPDETALMPKQLRQGLLFDGPSLIHHQTSGYTLKTVPANGAFADHVYAGVAPLFKMETSSPYSTINRSATGKWWSSKIPAASPGGQSDPVDSPADLIGKFTYTDATTVISFGVGYGNDTGNKALVTAVRFGEHRYSLACEPHPHPTPSDTPTAPSGDGGSSTPTTVPSGAPETGDGSAGGGNVALMAAGGLVIALGAGSGLMLWRRRGQD